MDAKALNRLCRRFRRKLRRLLVQAGVARVVLVALLVLPPLLALDWWLDLDTPLRCLSLAVYLIAVAATGWWTLVVPLSRRWRNEEVLAYFDSVLPPDRGMLLELYQLIRGEGIEETEHPRGQQMARQAAEDLGPLAREVRAAQAISRRRARRWVGGAVLAAALFAAAAVPLFEYLTIGCERLFNPFSSQRWPHLTTIALDEPETGWTVPQMESFSLSAQVTGVVPPEVVLAYRGETTGYWIKEKLPVRDDGSVAHTFPEVREPLRFYLRGGDFTTDDYRIEIIERPYLRRIAAHYDYPDYAGYPDRTVESGQLVGLEGTTVRLEFESSMALDKALFILEGEEPELLPLTSPTEFEKTLVLSADGSYAIELYEEHGFREAKPERYEIRVTPDNPPEVELLAPGRNLVATGRASVDVALRAKDDFGLKTVEFLYRIDDGEPAPLTDRITGPLKPDGKNSDSRFTWDLRKMELPGSGVLSYFVRVQDVNPTGRGVAETPKREIRLVKPSEFHFDTFERAKRIEAEARIAWESQFTAWELAGEWASTGSGKENDPVWQEITEKQDLAFRASQAMESYLRELIAQYEQNDMAREFMAGRLGVIAELLQRITGTEHPAVAAALSEARPRTEADAQPDRLLGLRTAALGRCAENQKLALLHLERLVKRLFDWRDLQTSLIRTTLLHEEQGEVLELTEKIAPKTLGLEFEDLPEDVQDKLMTLAKRQRTLYDVESELEKELGFQAYRAELQERRSILEPLHAAYKGLRDNRVNDNLKVAADKIEKNQSFQIVKNQKAALHVLDIVKGGLIQAGQKVDAEEPITLAMTPARILEVQPKAQPQGDQQPGPEEVAGATVAPISPEDLLANLPLGSDPLSTALNVAWESQDAVLARTRYLAENSTSKEMPRYVSLKQGILLEKQDGAVEAVGVAITEAEKAKTAPVQSMLGTVKEELLQSRKLIEERLLGGTIQQIQADSMESLDDLRRQFIPLRQAVDEAAEENRKRDGADAFNRMFLLRGQDLEHAVGILHELNHAHVLQRDVARKVTRFVDFRPQDAALEAVEKANRERAAAEQKQAAALLAGAVQRAGSLSEECQGKVGDTGVAALADLELAPVAETIAKATKDEELKTSLGEAAGLLTQTLRALKDLLGERVQPRLAEAETQPAPTEMTLEEWQRLRSPEVLREKLEADTRLPDEVRRIMLRALSKDFPPKYRELLAAYYASFVSEEKEKEKEK
jgi:hypothetical protein